MIDNNSLAMIDDLNHTKTCQLIDQSMGVEDYDDYDGGYRKNSLDLNLNVLSFAHQPASIGTGPATLATGNGVANGAGNGAFNGGINGASFTVGPSTGSTGNGTINSAGNAAVAETLAEDYTFPLNDYKTYPNPTYTFRPDLKPDFKELANFAKDDTKIDETYTYLKIDENYRQFDQDDVYYKQKNSFDSTFKGSFDESNQLNDNHVNGNGTHDNTLLDNTLLALLDNTYKQETFIPNELTDLSIPQDNLDLTNFKLKDDINFNLINSNYQMSTLPYDNGTISPKDLNNLQKDLPRPEQQYHLSELNNLPPEINQLTNNYHILSKDYTNFLPPTVNPRELFSLPQSVSSPTLSTLFNNKSNMLIPQLPRQTKVEFDINNGGTGTANSANNNTNSPTTAPATSYNTINKGRSQSLSSPVMITNSLRRNSTIPDLDKRKRRKSSEQNIAINNEVNEDLPSTSFPCTECDKQFKRSEHLKRHVRSVHSNIRPFHCKYCDKKFSRSDNLAQHLKTHYKLDNNGNQTVIYGNPNNQRKRK